MTTTPPKPKRLRRILLWIGVVAFTFFVGIPSALVLRTRFQISSALRSASTVRLEEYSFGKVLSTRTLTTAEFRHVSDATPLSVDNGIPELIALCFIPHHRIIVTDSAQHQTTFDVCFTCDQMRVADSGILSTPSAWRQPLRQLFLSHDIPIRDHYAPDFSTRSQVAEPARNSGHDWEAF